MTNPHPNPFPALVEKWYAHCDRYHDAECPICRCADELSRAIESADAAPSPDAGWSPMPPPKSGVYIVGNPLVKSTNQARWEAKHARWKFPSAQQAFDVTHWQPLPDPPPQVQP